MDQFLLIFDKSLTTTPEGGVSLYGYVNEDKQMLTSVSLNDDLKMKQGSLPIIWNWASSSNSSETVDPTITDTVTDPLRKNPTIKVKVPDIPGYYYSDTDPENYYLDLTDIQKLKEKGYTKDITFEQIKAYFDGGRK